MTAITKFEIIFKSYDKASWQDQLDNLVPKGRYLSEMTINGDRHVTIFCDADELDLARYSVEKFAKYVNRVCNSDVMLFESSGWGVKYGKNSGIDALYD